MSEAPSPTKPHRNHAKREATKKAKQLTQKTQKINRRQEILDAKKAKHAADAARANATVERLKKEMRELDADSAVSRRLLARCRWKRVVEVVMCHIYAGNIVWDGSTALTERMEAAEARADVADKEFYDAFEVLKRLTEPPKVKITVSPEKSLQYDQFHKRCKRKLLWRQALRAIAIDEYERIRMFRYLWGAWPGFNGEKESIDSFGLTLADTPHSMNYYTMTQKMYQLAIEDREYYEAFAKGLLFIGEYEDIYDNLPRKFIDFCIRALHKARRHWSKEDRRSAAEAAHAPAHPHARWHRFARLLVKLAQADAEETARNAAEAEEQRRVRAAAAATAKPQRALTTPGPSRQPRPVRWAEEAPDAGDQAKRTSTKAASLEAVKTAKAAKRAQAAREVEVALEMARNLAIGDAIVEA